MVCVMRPFGEVVLEPFEVLHTTQNLHDLAEKLKALDGETRVVLEATGNYHKPDVYKRQRHKRVLSLSFQPVRSTLWVLYLPLGKRIRSPFLSRSYSFWDFADVYKRQLIKQRHGIDKL